jgi:hypothetical protein
VLRWGPNGPLTCILLYSASSVGRSCTQGSTRLVFLEVPKVKTLILLDSEKKGPPRLLCEGIANSVSSRQVGR